jgi:hypothetical protein
MTFNKEKQCKNNQTNMKKISSLTLSRLKSKDNTRKHFLSSPSLQNALILESGSMENEKEKVYRPSQTIASMRVPGKIIKSMAKAKLCLLMATLSKESGLTIKLMDLECTFIEMGPFIKDIGNKIYRMDKVFRHGQMEANTKESTKTAKSMAKEYTYGQTAAIIQAHGTKTKFMDMENTFGLMAESMLGSGG